MPLRIVRKGDVVPPTAVERVRVEPQHVPVHDDIGTVRNLVPVRRELAPQPIPQTMYDGVGRDEQHSGYLNRPVQSLAFAEWLSVMAWPFQLLKVPSAMRVPIAPHQGLTPFGERVNIDMAPQTTLGNISSIKAPVTWAPQYAKLGVWT